MWSKARRIYRQLKDKLYGTRSHELLVFCFFLAVSFGFWLLQALNETLVRDVQVAVELDNVPEDVVIIDSLPAYINVTLRDRGLALARHSFSSLFRRNHIEIDFEDYDTDQEEGEVYIFSTDIQRMLRRVFASSTLFKTDTDTLRFAYNHGYKRILPVRLEGTFKASPQNYIQSVRVEPDSVCVYGQKELVDSMVAAPSEAFAIDNLFEAEGNYTIALRKERFRKCEPSLVNVKVNVGEYIEKTVKVRVVGLNFPADKKLRTFPELVSVICRVESGRYNLITKDDFVIATTYEELLQNTEDSRLLLNLKTVPEGVSNVRISPQDVDYLIEQVAIEE